MRSTVASLSSWLMALASVRPAVSLETSGSADGPPCFVSPLSGSLLASHRRPASAWEFAWRWVMGDKIFLKGGGKKQEY